MKFNQKLTPKLNADAILKCMQSSNILFFNNDDKVRKYVEGLNDSAICSDFKKDVSDSIDYLFKFKDASGIPDSEFWKIYFKEAVLHNKLTIVGGSIDTKTITLFNALLNELTTKTLSEKLDVAIGFGLMFDDFKEIYKNSFKEENLKKDSDFYGCSFELRKSKSFFEEYAEMIFEYSKVFLIGKTVINLKLNNPKILERTPLNVGEAFLDLKSLDDKSLKKIADKAIMPLMEYFLIKMNKVISKLIIKKEAGGLKRLLDYWAENTKLRKGSIFRATSILFKKQIWTYDLFEKLGFIALINNIPLSSSMDKKRFFNYIVDGIDTKKEGG